MPIAGNAKRFADVGYLMPKPLIPVRYKHIIDLAMESIKLDDCNLIFIVRTEQIHNFSIDAILKEKFGQDTQIIAVDRLTEGAVSTCLLAKDLINNELPLIIYTPDVCFKNQFDPNTIDPSLDGFALTFKANSSDHSYIQTNVDGVATKVAEKSVISSQALVGVYCYKQGKTFVEYAEKSIQKNIRVNNEFYISLIYNLMIEDGLTIKAKQVEKLYVLGTPMELEFFINHSSKIFGNTPVALACDHSGFEQKEKAKAILKELGIKVIDFGTYVNKNCDYNDFVSEAIKSVKNGFCDYGLVFCATGQGVNIFANKHKGIISALIYNEYSAEYAIRHNTANFFSFASKFVSDEELRKILTNLSNYSFDGGRHTTRMIKTIKNDLL